ncbi:MAG: MFS transporter [Gammaproteobacteria bacterium]|nr:MFS transporter [Gammaproteobacteria bacterium]
MSQNQAAEQTILGTPAASPAGYYSWTLFEWARNPYVILVTIYLFAPYFSTTVVGDPVKGQSLLGYTNSISGALIALLAPFLGAIADKNGRRKPWIAVFVTLMVPSVFLLWYSVPGGGIGIYPVLGLIVIIAVVFEFSAVFHNAMLPSVAPRNRLGFLSGLAIGLGNVGGLLLMIFVLYAFALPGQLDWPFIPETTFFGIDQAANEHNRIVGPLTAVWLMLFSLPLFMFTPDGISSGAGIGESIHQGLKEVWYTIRRVRHYANVALYLIARMIFNDGMVGVLIFGGVYAAGVFHWDTITMLIFGIVTSFSAAIGALLGGWFDDRFGSKAAVLLAVGGTALLLTVGVSIEWDSMLFVIPLNPDYQLWELVYFNTPAEFLYFANTQFFAMFITVGFASARSMMARISPPDMVTQFFGLYALSGTATAFLAPLLVGVFTDAFNSQRAGYASLIILLTLGFVLMIFVREEQAERAS